MNNEYTPHNPETQNRTLPRFDSEAKKLLSDESIAQLPVEQQGQVILDRFIGTLLRHGAVAGSQKEYTPAEILSKMDEMSRRSDDALREITNTDGLRRAVFDLASDARLGGHFGHISERLATDAEGRPALTSMTQIEGYLLAGGTTNQIRDGVGGVHMHGDSWVPVILEHTQRMAQDAYVPWMTLGKARELMTSSAPLIQNTGRDWEMATHSAEKVGVDMDLLRRSAEKIQSHVRASRDMAATALSVLSEDKVARYKNDLDRRSGYRF